MAINKVIDRNNNVLIDLTNDTVKPDKVLLGTKFHGSDGKEYTGMLPVSEIDELKYRFYDFDGTLLYSFTDDEIDAMTELPEGPDHTEDNLTFQGWNWTLEELKEFDRTRNGRPIVGAHAITTDGKTYIYLNIPSGRILAFSASSVNSVDWGDGTVDTNTSHTYTAAGDYTVIVDVSDTGYFILSSSSTSNTSAEQFVYKLRLGKTNKFGIHSCHRLETVNIPVEIASMEYQAARTCNNLRYITHPRFSITYGGPFYECTSLTTVSLAGNLTALADSYFYNCSALRNITPPDSIKSIGGSTFYNCRSLKYITLPKNLTTLGSQVFSNCCNLKGIVIPDGVTRIESSSFESCENLEYLILSKNLTYIGNYAIRFVQSLKNIVIPDSVTTLTQYCLSANALNVDLSEQTKVINITTDIGLSSKFNIIKVPSHLLDQYKSATYWSNYASIMVGV